MNNTGLARWAALGGVIGAALLIIGSQLFGAFLYLPSADEIVAMVGGNFNQSFAGAYLGALSAFFLIWFGGSVRGALRERDERVEWLASVAFAGIVATAVVIAAANGILSMLAARFASEDGASAEVLIALYDSWSAITGLVMPLSLATFVGAASAAIIQTRMFPAWFGWVGVVAMIGSLSPVGYIVQTAALVWMVALSIWLFARGASPAPRYATGDTVAG